MGIEWLKPGVVLGTILYAVIGVIVLWVSFIAIDKLTPYKLWEEICDKQEPGAGHRGRRAMFLAHRADRGGGDPRLGLRRP